MLIRQNILAGALLIAIDGTQARCSPAPPTPEERGAVSAAPVQAGAHLPVELRRTGGSKVN
jgi:hypothetical protein